ncbi:MAG TPA: tetratricopeptide repeat protein [Caldithrix abyssi]|uniref:Tetratricopeptide repeat protein n=1 Tax=Caldithrix abyssi TaxID=187145 RepID=A0A7V5LJM1_CALAY|nr:tetratricopeptide repeat protein [Caldithrix abyssi]
MIHFNKKTAIIISLIFLLSCAYYNTFFNAKRYYNKALEKQKNTKSTQKLPGDVKKNYQAAIEKSWKLIKIYGDSNKYADDALLLIGKAYYNIGDYTKAERTLNQFLLKFLKSDLIPEAKLWLARTYVAQERKEDALKLLNSLLSQKLPKRLAAEAFYILGKLHFEQGEYEEAIKFLTRSVDITRDDEMKGDALFMMGDAYYQLNEYENAIDSYDKLSKLDIPAVREYEATAKKVESLIELEKYEEAEKILRKMLSSPRFKDQFSLIETRLANLYEIQGETDLARDYYYEIIKKYQRKEGAILSYYYLGQLYEYEYANFDSAQSYYEKVKNLKSNPEVLEDAREKSKLLKEYLKLRDLLSKDKQDLLKLQRGDSLLTDSLEVAGDSIVVGQSAQEQANLVQTKFGMRPKKIFEIPEKENEEFWQRVRFYKDSLQKARRDTILTYQDSLKLFPEKKAKKRARKVLVSRTPEEVKESFKKNSFAKAEYFLLKYQNYDSAATAYAQFAKQFDDSVLTPKAYYTLYYIYHNLKHDSLKADSLRQLIISKYPETIYGKKLRGVVDKKMEVELVSQSATLYRQAEDLLDQAQYKKALQIFKQIAETDSGSVWAQKARFAIAYIYEKYLNNVQKAIDAYSELVKEYPTSKFATIAKNKIAPPPPEPTPEEQAKAEKQNETKQKTLEGETSEDQEKQQIKSRKPPLEEKKVPAQKKPLRER